MQKPLYCCDEYTVDSAGFVISKRGKPLKPSVDQHGYQIINLMINGKRIGMTVHKAVARTFLADSYAPGLQVNHKDGNKLNNSVENLEWVTGQENINHAKTVLGLIKSGSEHCNAIPISAYDKKTGELKMQFDSLIEAAYYFEPVDYMQARGIMKVISNVKAGRKKSYRGYIWK